MSNAPEVSVVIVAWEARDHVLRCLRSLHEYAGLPFQAIVVDDGSGDGTSNAVRTAFPSTAVVAKERSEGLPSGRNAALAHVTGRFVLMLDADTEVRPGALPTLAHFLDARPEAGLVGPRLIFPAGELQLSSRRFPPFLAPFTRRGPIARLRGAVPSHRRHLMEDWDHAEERPVVWVAGAAQMWRADLPRRIGTYDERVSSYGGEDLDWCLRVWEAGLQVWYTPRAEIVHVWQKRTRESPYGAQSRRALRDWYYLQWKHRALRHDPRLVEALR
jgi:N-acetylglucosaminyl-diphospho-decaprenol L-rhamnosyltransferase